MAALLAVFIGATVCWALLWAILPILRRTLLDKPNERSSHIHPTPRGGGVSFVIVALVFSALSYLVDFLSGSVSSPLLALPLLAFPLALTGFIDDRNNIPSSWRYAVHLSTALMIFLSSPLFVPSFDLLPLFAFVLIFVTAVINFTNFMDGIDGLVTGCMAVAITAAAIQLSAPLPIWALVGALLGFLFWNWSPAKVFMGDVGSTFLGAVFVGIVLQANSWSQVFALLLVATPLLGDACLCVLRRLMARHRVFQAHRLHLFQRLHQAGWSHARISNLYIAATAFLTIVLIWGDLPSLFTLAVAELMVGVWLDQKVAVPFSEASRN